jgi:zinc/manganese transport system substrate-binding protein
MPARMLTMLMALCCAASASAGLRVVTTTETLAAIAREVGGDRISVSSLTRGYEDTHFIPPKPSLMRALQRADALVIVGLELEVGWLPVVLPGSRNPGIQPGSRGFIDASQRVEVLEKATGPVDRSMGDVHPGGNPHYLTDPVAHQSVAALLADRLGELDHANAAAFAEGAAKFSAKINERLAGWAARLKPFAGRSVVTYHNNMPYLIHRFGLRQFGFIEPRPGIPPTARHLEDLAAAMKSAGVMTILYQPYHAPEVVKRLAARSGARAILTPEQVGGVPDARDAFSFIEYLVGALEQSLHD